MQLAMVIERYFPFGGLQRDMLRIATKCHTAGHTVTVFASEWTGPKPEWMQVRLAKVSAITNTGKTEKFNRWLNELKLQSTYDCVVGFSKLSGLDLYYAGDPCVAERMASRPAWQRALPRYRQLIRQEAHVFARSGSTEILLIAHQEKEKFQRHYNTEARRFHLLPPGIEHDRFIGNTPTHSERVALREELEIHASDFFLLMVGSAFRTKGLDRSLAAIASLPETLRKRCHLVVIGEGDVAPYHAMAQQLNIGRQLHIVGAREDVARYYYSADLLLHPAVTENTGTAILEAMVCGLPVLTTANCGYAHFVVEGDAGKVCAEPFEQERLARLLQQMLDEKKLRTWQEGAKQYTETHDLYSMVDKVLDLIVQSAQQKKTRQEA